MRVVRIAADVRSPHGASPRAEVLVQEYLIDRGLLPGDRIPAEALLCSELGISRTVVREAMRFLQSLGLVEIRRGRGTFLAEMCLPRLADNLTFWGRLLQGEDDVASRIDEVTAIIEAGPRDNWIVTETLHELDGARRSLQRGVAAEGCP